MFEGKKQCPQCYSPVGARHRICGECGHDFALPPLCKECGERKEKCPDCGAMSCPRCCPDACPRCNHNRDIATKHFAGASQ